MMQIPPLLTIGTLILSSTTILLARESTPISSILSSLSTTSPYPDSNSPTTININNSPLPPPESAPNSFLDSALPNLSSLKSTAAQFIPTFHSLLLAFPPKPHEISKQSPQRQLAVWIASDSEEAATEKSPSNPASPIATLKPKREIIGACVALVGVMGIMAML